MGTGYTRNDTSNNIADGNIINAADLDGEFDAIESAMGTSGHTHDGTSAEGGPVTVLGPVQDFVASATEIKPKTTNTLDIGTSGLLFKDMFLDGVATIGSIKIDNAGTIGTATTGDAITISSDGIVTFKDDIIVKDGGTIGVTSAVDAMTISSAGIVTFKDDIIIKDGGTIGSASDADAIAISSGGVVTFSQAVSNLGNVTGKTGSGFVLALQTSDTTIEATNVLGKIEFSAPDEASGTDAILVGASIEALAEDTFDSSTNSTALVFKTNTTGAATERMRIKSDGNISLTGATTISNTSGDLTLDVAGDLILDSDSPNWRFKDNGTSILEIGADSQNPTIYAAVADKDIQFKGNDGGSTITALTLDMSDAGTAIFNHDITLPDNGKAIFGAGSDLQIYHDGSHSYIRDVGTGLMRLTAQDFLVEGSDGSDIIYGVQGGATSIYHAGLATLATTSAGIDVTGTVTADGLTVDGDATINANLPNLYLTETDSTDLNTRIALQAGVQYLSSVNDALTVTKNRISWDNSTGDISFYEDTGTTAKFFWDAADERLGIGTSTMYETLRVSGPRQNTSVGYDTVASIYSDDSFAEDAGAGISLGGKYNTSGSITGFAEIAGLKENSTDGNYAGSLSFKTRTNGISNITERMRIDSSGDLTVKGGRIFVNESDNGNIAVGLTRDADEGYVQVYSAGSITSSIRGNGDSYFNGGNIGIGTSSPASDAQLSISAPEAPHIYFERSNSGRYDSAIGMPSAGDLAFYLGANSSTVSGLSERMRITSAGSLLAGKSVTTFNTTGMQIDGPNGNFSITASGATTAFFNRTSTDGNIAEFYKDGSTVGSIGARSGDLGVATGNTGIRFYDASRSILPYDPTVPNEPANVISLGDSGSTFKDLYLSGGVYLGGTGAANKLDDYEEGTWTPVITPEGGSAAGITVNHATYTKVGRLVSLVFDVTIDSISGTSSSNAIELTGMPFNSATSHGGGPNIGYGNLTASMTGTLALSGNTTSKYRIVNLDGTTALNASDHLQATSRLEGQFTYHTT